jgi:thiol-disulfide isomerase/thioredoxin
MTRSQLYAFCLISAIAAALPAIAQDTKGDAASPSKAASPSTERPADESATKPSADPNSVPDGTPKELKEYIQNLVRNIPDDPEARKKVRAAVLKAAEKMLAARTTEEELDFAIDAKLRSLDTSQQIAAFSRQLKAEGRERQARVAENYALQIGMREALLSGKKDQLEKQTAAALAYFKQSPPQADDLGLAIMTGQVAEFQGNQYAIGVYTELSKIFTASKEEKLVEFGRRMEGVARRLALLGNKIRLEGKFLSGETFDLSKYEGKIVLVDFWASWRGRCVADLPELRKVYEKYRDKGFDLVGFACDYRREDVEKFLREHSVPWPTVYGENGPSPAVEYYGILTIPTMILLDRDGKVIDLNVRLEELDKRLEKLIGQL